MVECVPDGGAACAPDARGNIGNGNVGANNFGNNNVGSDNTGAVAVAAAVRQTQGRVGSKGGCSGG